MTDDKDKAGGKRRGRGLSGEEKRLWDYAVQDVRRVRPDAPLPDMPAPDRAPGCSQDRPQDRPPHAVPSRRGAGQGLPPVPQAPPGQPPELDHRTEARLRKGRIPIEAVLDLHGMTQPDAHAALSRFIRESHAAQKRCVLVVTGKGGDRVRGAFPSDYTGVLRQRLPEWLGQMPLSPLVLRCEPARRQHGGDGAFYVYLKRLRAD